MIFSLSANNPTSSAIFRDELKELLAFCKRKNIFVMIDETYVEFAPDINEISSMSLISSFDNLMILRGVSKFYAAPGRRGCSVSSGSSADAEPMESEQPRRLRW